MDINNQNQAGSTQSGSDHSGTSQSAPDQSSPSSAGSSSASAENATSHENHASHTDHSSHTEHPENATLMGVLAYLGILIIIPFFVAKDNPFVKFHIRQGLVLVVVEIILSVAMRMFWALSPLLLVLQLVTFILSIIGIVNVFQKKEKELPIIGSYAKTLKI